MVAVKYAIFAGIATLVNIFFQWVSFHVYVGFGGLWLAMGVGTLAGLFTKYVLDKKWIFYHTPRDIKDDAKKFIMYSLMGVFTTLIFWGVETAFYYLFSFSEAKYVGAVVGLTIGYFIKYHLDKRFVFVNRGDVNDLQWMGEISQD